MANPTSNFNWQMPTNTDLVKDLPADFEVFGQAVDTSLADLKGGTSGQILSKNSNTDMDFVWINNDQGDITGVTASSPLTGGGTSGAITVGIQDGTTAQKGAVQLENSTSSTSTTTAAVPASVKSAYDLANAAIPKSLVDAAGDILYATANDTVARLAIGTAGQVLKVNSGATAPEWGTATSGMTLITRQTVTNAADTGSSFNNVFSSSYNTYCVIIETMGSSLNNVLMQFKNSGGTYTSTYYGNSAYALYSASSFSFLNTNNASAYTVMGAAAVNARATIWINGVGNSSARATYSGNGHEGNNNRFYVFGGELGVEDVWTGLLFKMASGNITITASVYGLAK